MTTINSGMSQQEYTKRILHIADTDGMEIANTVNHRALEIGQITLAYFQVAAQQLANRIIYSKED